MGEDGGPDLINRDPNNLNDSLSATFEEVFGEPDNLHSPDCAWKCGYCGYEGGRKCCYAFLTIISTWLLGLCWGCCYAITSCCMVWSVTPSLKMWEICCACTIRYTQAIMDCCIGTQSAAYGECLSKIKITQTSS